MPGVRMEQTHRRVHLGMPSYRSHCNQRRGYRCPALAPVLEHYETPEELSSPTYNRSEAAGDSQAGNACKKSKLRVLRRLRDRYVKLLNDVALGTDSAGMSAFYGCPAVADNSAYRARLLREEREEQARLQAMQLQLMQGSRIFTGAFA